MPPRVAPQSATDRASGTATVDVWTLRLSALPDGCLEARAAILSAAERERLARFRVRTAHDEYLAGKVLVRTVLSSRTGVRPEDWVFGACANGKPHVLAPAAYASLRFTLSHSSGVVVAAVSHDRSVGVDVESLDRPIDVDALAERYFAAEEIAELAALSSDARRRRFFEHWTLKESYLKARGLRLMDVVGHASFATLGPAVVATNFAARLNDDPARWQFSLHAIFDRHVLALAVHREPGERVDVRWDVGIAALTSVPALRGVGTGHAGRSTTGRGST